MSGTGTHLLYTRWVLGWLRVVRSPEHSGHKEPLLFFFFFSPNVPPLSSCPPVYLEKVSFSYFFRMKSDDFSSYISFPCFTSRIPPKSVRCLSWKIRLQDLTWSLFSLVPFGKLRGSLSLGVLACKLRVVTPPRAHGDAWLQGPASQSALGRWSQFSFLPLTTAWLGNCCQVT